MALFTDGAISSIENLTDQDSSVLEVSNVEGINLTTKLALAKEEIGIDLTSLFQRYRTNTFPVTGQPVLDLQHVAITTPVRLWHTYQTLTMVYRDAYYNQLNDRYRGKWDEYRSLAKWAQNKLLETGVGVVFDPVPQALAPVLTAVSGTGTGGTLFVSVSFLNAKAEEGSASDVTSIILAPNQAISIGAAAAPVNAQSWNVYVGGDPTQLALQNVTPLDLLANWVYSTATAQAGRQPGSGQAPNFTRQLPRMLQRG